MDSLAVGNLPLAQGCNILSRSLIQFSVDGWGSVPSLQVGLRPNYGRGNSSNGDLLQKHLGRHTLQLPELSYSVPLTPRQATVDPLLDTHRQVWLSLLWGHYSCMLGFGTNKTKVLFVLSKSLFHQSSSIIRSHLPSKSNSLGVLRIGNTWTIFSD